VARCEKQTLVIVNAASRAAGGLLRETTLTTNWTAENGARFNFEITLALVIHRTFAGFFLREIFFLQ
jgi:hypothetical protein